MNTKILQAIVFHVNAKDFVELTGQVFGDESVATPDIQISLPSNVAADITNMG